MNVLAMGAHFDDIELGCGGSIAKYINAGYDVTVYVATESGFSDHRNKTIRSSEVAREEAEEAMRILGVKRMICGSFQALKLEFVDELNVDILKIVEEQSIDLVITHWAGDIHHDHYALAKASLHGCRHVPRMLMYRSNWYHTHDEFRGNFYIDISEYWKIKEEAIKAHKSEMKRTGEKWIKFFENEAENAGQRIGVEKAEVFQVIKWLEE